MPLPNQRRKAEAASHCGRRLFLFTHSSAELPSEGFLSDRDGKMYVLLMTLDEFTGYIEQLPDTDKMPAVFIGHGSPMNGIEETVYSLGWKALGQKLPRPNAILSISAHWYVEGTYVHVARHPRTIHDFWGFPKELYALTYPCPGAPELARGTKALLGHRIRVGEDTAWGLDHGTWVPLLHMFPDHAVPVFQLSIDLTKPPSFHFELGAMLSSLRRKGVLVMGSGNIVHNLGEVDFSPTAQPYDWAIAFDQQMKELILNDAHQQIVDHHRLGPLAHRSIPIPDHYLPLLYILGLKEERDAVAFPVEGISHGSISMRSVLIG
jgi:4,5-DOPA dioxygenase extradiol